MNSQVSNYNFHFFSFIQVRPALVDPKKFLSIFYVLSFCDLIFHNKTTPPLFPYLMRCWSDILQQVDHALLLWVISSPFMKFYQDLAKYAFCGGFKLLIVYLLKMIWQTIRYKFYLQLKAKVPTICCI